ncbi:G_PROTEIN_RECEP_F1_2 domain-containing protein [Meloidogyne graminicola]|uniref:G_PROTEIN_RECEP_F1_2 domain-containing protein n=1 Tax=Meloidogyne graminicola TaxID=189291 RepID=A0A8S9ZSQ5_9BILA|nr:G_PROTEIN_RECEP_F1_2 domain-containing protein [Meloidogyne graminicola]
MIIFKKKLGGLFMKEFFLLIFKMFNILLSTNNNYINCNSQQPWRLMGKYLDLFILPIICIFGLLLNILCIYVFLKRKKINKKLIERKYSPSILILQQQQQQQLINNNNNNISSNINIYRNESFNLQQLLLLFKQKSNEGSHPLVPALIVLCLCDSLQLIFSIFVLYLPALHDYLEMDPLGIIAQLAYLATGGLAGGLLSANCASIWTICFISFQRYKAILNPLINISSSKTTKNFHLFLIPLCALIFNIPVWFEFKWAINIIKLNNGQKRIIIWHEPSTLAKNEQYNFLMYKVLYPLCVYLIPLILISFLNIRMLSSIRFASRSLISVGQIKRIEREKRSVKLLIAIVLLFFLCHTGGLIIRFVDLKYYGNEPCFIFAKDLVNFLFNINSFANPMLYFFFTKQFKDLRTTYKLNTGTNNILGRRIMGPHPHPHPPPPHPPAPPPYGFPSGPRFSRILKLINYF